MEEPQVPEANADAQQPTHRQVGASAGLVAEFDPHSVVNDADNPDITEGYANLDIATPKETVEEQQEAREVLTRSYPTLIIADIENEDFGEDILVAVVYATPNPTLSRFHFFRTTLSPKFLICFMDLQQPQFISFKPILILFLWSTFKLALLFTLI